MQVKKTNTTYNRREFISKMPIPGSLWLQRQQHSGCWGQGMGGGRRGCKEINGNGK